MAFTNLDILSETIGLQSLCNVYALKKGYDHIGVQFIFDVVNGKDPANAIMADMIIEQVQTLPFMEKTTFNGVDCQ